MATIIDEANRKLAQLAQEVAQLRNENSYLRRQTGKAHDYHYHTAPRILRRALDDALAMLVLIMNDMPTSRQFMHELGYSERRYYWAIGLLRAARVMAPRGRRVADVDFKTAEQRLQSKYESLKTEQDALEKLRLYMPKKMQYTYGSGSKTRDTMP
jgi:hypothetical protein